MWDNPETRAVGSAQAMLASPCMPMPLCPMHNRKSDDASHRKATFPHCTAPTWHPSCRQNAPAVIARAVLQMAVLPCAYPAQRPSLLRQSASPSTFCLQHVRPLTWLGQSVRLSVRTPGDHGSQRHGSIRSNADSGSSNGSNGGGTASSGGTFASRNVAEELLGSSENRKGAAAITTRSLDSPTSSHDGPCHCQRHGHSHGHESFVSNPIHRVLIWIYGHTGGRQNGIRHLVESLQIWRRRSGWPYTCCRSWVNLLLKGGPSGRTVCLPICRAAPAGGRAEGEHAGIYSHLGALCRRGAGALAGRRRVALRAAGNAPQPGKAPPTVLPLSLPVRAAVPRQVPGSTYGTRTVAAWTRTGGPQPIAATVSS